MTDKTPVIPEGTEFLSAVAEMEDACETLTDRELPKMGEKAPKCLSAFGTVLSLLDRVGSCFWCCPGAGYEAHMVQYMAARGSSYARAAIRLAKLGFYDEALSLVRSLGELANLLELFQSDKAVMVDWKTSDRKKRGSQYRPGQIRARLVQLGVSPAMDDARYSLLCELSTHPVPELRPQAFNAHGQTTVGGRYQPVGLLLVLNETAVLASVVLLFSAVSIGIAA